MENFCYTCKPRLGYILNLFLNFRSSEPGYSYKLYSYKKRVYRGFSFSCKKKVRTSECMLGTCNLFDASSAALDAYDEENSNDSSVSAKSENGNVINYYK